MELKLRYLDNIAIIEINGEIDINSSALIELVGKLIKEGVKNMVLDLRLVGNVDYNGLSVLAIAYKSMLNCNGIMKLADVSSQIMELLHIVRLDGVFSVYKDTDEAVRSFYPKKFSAGQTREADEKEHPLRRKYRRLGIDVTVYYKSRRQEKLQDSPMYSGIAGNISGAGLFLRAITMLPIGTQVDLDIVLPETKGCISCKGIIMWIADKQLQPDFYPGMGIKFIDIDSKKQDEIIHFIERHIAK